MQRPIGEHVGLVPLPYNRFAGNPPAGHKAEECFEAEMGFPYPVHVVYEVLESDIDPSKKVHSPQKASGK